MNKLATIVTDETQRSQVRALIYEMLADAGAEFMDKSEGLTASELFSIINKKVGEL